MSDVQPTVDQTTDLLQNLTLDSQSKASEIAKDTEKTSVYQYGSANLGNPPNGQPQKKLDPTMSYTPNGYRYGNNGWVNSDGTDIATAGYGDNSAAMYSNLYGFTFGPYSPAASPVPGMRSDGQLYAPQQYQYPSHFHPSTTTSGPMSSSSVAPKVNSNGIANNGSVHYKPTSNSLYNWSNTNGRGSFQNPRFGSDRPVTSNGVTSSFSKSKNGPFQRKQNYNPNSHFMGYQHLNPAYGMGPAHGYYNGMYPSDFYGYYGGAYHMNYGSNGYNSYNSYNGYNSKTSGRGWFEVDGKYNKPRGRGYGCSGNGNDNIDGLNELNRGPRSKGGKNQNTILPVTVQNLSSDESNGEKKVDVKVDDVSRLELYNKADFPEVYADAKFFIIKSYSEDDVHKSIKYNVWASTPNGNKKLDASYRESQQIASGCPVFLLFSVNTSGQFVGLAEMMGPVDFEKNVEYWQQDKWTGCFSVKWHIVKDVPNNLLKHITLENNENKPVTNSRDTQEVKLEHGLRMIKIFKDHLSKTSILDDFEFYESRQKIIQEKKAKQQLIHKQVWDGKTKEKKIENESGAQMLKEMMVSDMKEESTLANDNDDNKENGLSAEIGIDMSKSGEPVSADNIENVSNEVVVI